VPRSSGYFRFVETLLHKGVTGGCSATDYCPTNAVTREQMAVFVLVGKEGAGYGPAACTTPLFGDVPASSPFCRWIEELSRRGITSGCGGGNYCPADPVTREQMAVFVTATFGLALYGPDGLTLQPLAEISEYAWAWGSEAPVAFDGSLLYVPLGAPGLAIYSLSDPTAPQRLALVGAALLDGQAGAVAAAGQRAYVATPDKGVIVELDVSVPTAPQVRSRFGGGIPGIARLALRGSHLFVKAGSSTAYLGGVYVFDVSTNPPSLAGQYLTNLVDPGFDVSPTGWAFLARTPATADDSAKIDVIDMSNPAAPILLTTWVEARPMNVSGLVVQGDRLYGAGYWGGPFVLTGAATTPLVLEAEYDWSELPRYAWDVAAAPPFVFISRGDAPGRIGSFQAFRQAGASLIPVWERAATFPIHSVAVSGDLFVTVEQESPQVPSPHKLLKLYRISAD
jgi:hypothetical protein